MKIGRLILTHRQDLILPLKNFYLPSKTEFLVLAYNQITVKPDCFEQTKNFKLMPYLGKGAGGSILGQQFLVWADAAKNYPEIDFWIVQDYDILCMPTDIVIASHVGRGQYGMIGNPFAFLRRKNRASQKDVFPFFYKDVPDSLSSSRVYRYLEEELKKIYPLKIEGEECIYTGYGDFLATSKENISLLGEERLRNLKEGGAEQVPHTVFSAKHILPVDLRQFFSMKIILDPTLYVNFNSKYDFSHPVKYWPGSSVKPNFKLRMKSFIKYLLKFNRVAKNFPE
jgi:hypothetical protein